MYKVILKVALAYLKRYCLNVLEACFCLFFFQTAVSGFSNNCMQSSLSPLSSQEKMGPSQLLQLSLVPWDFIPFALQLVNDVEFKCELIEETYLKRGLKAA